ncbi:C4-dicarboxylate ABC transporter [Saccharomonospora piscinae]|uniref:C4-dicarboxylate ABC transporter n=1 Tax=Saccharomonospora piscinae TaxID=687388 RepID=A0A1V9AD61_SACPI|nr:TRAP transporter permease [Saccharomonospora piscinae]OQO95021.1 C4-dicarboxylate ABC transporter [Saccharomonospora piscinae]TLW90412.1 TRAP transporter permease [Saccharomonospora piscinae]
MADDTAAPGSTTASEPGTATAEKEAREKAAAYDRESRYRTQLGPWKWVVAVLGTALTLFQLYTALFGTFTSIIQGAVHVGMALSLVYLLYPAHRAGASKPGVPPHDVLLCALALGANGYIVVNYEQLTTQSVVFGFETVDVVVAVAAIALILEATRRCVGLPIVVIAVAALAYGYYGPSMPIFSHPGFTFDALVSESVYSSTTVFGTPIQVSSTFIFLFLFFGVILVRTNIGKFFNDLAFGLTGRRTGGTAKAAVVASGLQGMVSGSSVANTVASGSFTIPMMKRAGFRPQVAGAAEAAASTGGQLVPPVMGAAVFIMAEYTGTPYNELILFAIVPAALYFLGVFCGVHFEARRTGVLGTPKDQLPVLRSLLTRLYLLAPLVVIIGLLLAGRSAANAALFGILTALLVSFLRADTRLSARQFARLFEDGARTALPVIAACATAGIIAGTVTRTGLGGKLAGGIVDLSMGSFALVLVLTMLACLLLGMGLPTTANYVVTATVAAPILVELGVPIVAAHFFVFYFGIVADITPPVCLAAYAGAGLARANPMRTGVTAVKLAIPGFLVPYVFVLEPQLLLQDVTVTGFAVTLLTAVVGIAAVSAGLIGYTPGGHPAWRFALVAGGLAGLYPEPLVSVAGLAMVAAVVVAHRLRRGGDRDGADQNGADRDAAVTP